MRVPILVVLLALSAASCLAPAPRVAVEARAARVRSDSREEATRVARMVDRLAPRVLELLPDTRLDGLEVWVQDEPALYRRPKAAASDAEGLFSESHGRILLARGADSLSRTLAHELVHAALGRSWRALPGSLEEGLCDWVSAQIADDEAPRLRAGRLSSAALACGGIDLDLDVRPRESSERTPAWEPWSARIALTSREADRGAHLDVFRVQAGLSSSTLATGTKRGFYGLSFLLVERIAARHGIEGLHALCVHASDEGFDSVPSAWLLEAAGLGEDREPWRRAAIETLGPEELSELLRMYPEFVVEALVDYLQRQPGAAASELDELEVRLSLQGGRAELDVGALEFVRRAVRARMTADALLADA